MFEVGLMVFDPSQRIKYINQLAIDILELPAEWRSIDFTLHEILESSIARGDFEADQDALETAKNLLNGQQMRPFQYIRTNKAGRVLKVTGRSLESGDMAITYTDISELDQAQRQLERQNEILHREVEINQRQLKEEKLAIERESEIRNLLLSNTHHGITLHDRDLRLVICNRRFGELFELPDHLTRGGSPLEDLIRFLAERGDYGDVDIESSIMEKIRQTRRFKAEQYQRVTPDGRILEIVHTPVPMGVVTTYSDVTETVKARNDAQEAMVLQTKILEASPSGMGITRLRDGSIRWINTPGARLLGFDRIEDALGYVSRDAWVNPEKRAIFLEEFKRSGFIKAKEVHARRITGEEFWCYISWNRIRFEDDDCILFWMYDMTGQRETMRKLVESEKLASLGELVAGVAHEINTPIGVVVTGASQLQELVADCRAKFDQNELTRRMLQSHLEQCEEAANIILTNTRAAARLIQSFKQVSVDQASEEAREIRISEYFDQVIQSLHPKTKRSGVAITLDCPAGHPFRTFPGALAQILTNLVQNAIVHGLAERANAKIHIAAHIDDAGYLCVFFHDNGTGVAPEIQKRIFDPFFTTKRGSGGSGLGLNIVHNLVTHKLQGTIELSSDIEEGCAFAIRIPELKKQQENS